jgi:D-alanyl-lipoteichoic acid acyltransferase DltB (MBOAT superfamily)
MCVVAVVVVIYFGAMHSVFRKRPRLANWFLLIISYAFFVAYSPTAAAILFVVSLLAYAAGIIIENSRQRPFPRSAKIATLMAVAVVVPLLVFKYYNFVVANIAHAFRFVNVDFSVAPANWIIPLGISFFTFQALGYVLDVRAGREKAERNLPDFLLFVGFFPQIASGPISRASELLPQIKSERTFNYDLVVSGLRLMLWGYFLKAVFADRLALYANPVFASYQNFSGVTCLKASLCYTLQIYGDFAGYSLMAIGLARVFGFRIVDNFMRPYFAVSVTDFWRRWHISLSRWLRDYIYIPLGGSRCSKPKTYRNILVTFLVSGIWHGANWTFIVWGLIHGVVQAIEKFLGLQKAPSSKVVKAVRIAITFLIVNFAWIFFRSPSIADAWQFIAKIFTAAPGLSLDTAKTDVLFMAMSVAIVFVKELVEETDGDSTKISLFSNQNIVVRWTSYFVVVFLILLCGVLDAGQFIYVNF